MTVTIDQLQSLLFKHKIKNSNSLGSVELVSSTNKDDGRTYSLRSQPLNIKKSKEREDKRHK